MNLNRLATKRTFVVGAVVLAVCVGAGAAIAATKNVFDPKEEQEAFQAVVAEKLGVTTTELQNAYKAAALEQVEAAVAAGRLTEEQADAIRERIESGDFLGPHGFAFGFGSLHVMGGPGRLDGAADHLGLTEAELHEKLRAGQSLAEIAKAAGKSVDGLEQALLAAAKERLDQAVEDGRITAAQRDEMLERLESKIDALVKGEPFMEKHGPGFGQRFGGPMDGAFVPLAPDA
jgi:Arc/MetJ-type ribon-helix-helix transcriptional regulator